MQRRLAAILAADLVGYSRLMEQDEDGTLARVQSALDTVFRSLIESHNGRVVKIMGDGLLAEFPSAIGAVACAIRIQAELSDLGSNEGEHSALTYRIGINLSDTVFADGDIFGNGVNVASRVEALAPAGGICVTRAVRDQVRDRIDAGLEDYGQITVKNIKRPVRVFRVVTDEQERAALTKRRSGTYWQAGRILAAACAASAVLFFEWSGPTRQPPTDAPGYAVAERQGLLRVDRRSNLRQGPGTTFAVAETVNPGTEFVLTGLVADPAGAWYRVEQEGGADLYIFSELATIKREGTGTGPDADRFLSDPLVTLDLSSEAASTPDARQQLKQQVDALIATAQPVAFTEASVAVQTIDQPEAPVVRGSNPVVAGTSDRPVWIRIGLDFESGIYTDCIPVEAGEAHEIALTSGAAWTRITLAGLEDASFEARAVPRDGGWSIEVWPYRNAWSEADIVSVPLPGISPGQSGRAFSTKRPPAPLNHCGHFAVYAHVVERPPG